MFYFDFSDHAEILVQTYEAQRDLLTEQIYKRSHTGVAERTYTYNALGIPLTRSTARQGTTRNDTFGYNKRNELTSASQGALPYAYAYDNIGNRKSAQEDAENITYQTNELNQYTDITTAEETFVPEYDLNGNQTKYLHRVGVDVRLRVLWDKVSFYPACRRITI